jgi:RimJ/RimL family protein N-acetyltransferase
VNPVDGDLEGGRTVSRVTFARDPDGYLSISWWIHPDYRRAGLGSTAVALALQDKKEPVRALIRPHNEASLALANKLGFEVISMTKENILMEWRRR